ncbi:MAG TPA: outer membrane beta-barrel protein [Bacteroidales bacterium]|nr:outer membrane beta-barrel protein [Bacteroidales bacterium]
MCKCIKVKEKNIHFAIKVILMFLFVLFFTIKNNALLGQQNSSLSSSVLPKSWALNIQLTPTLSSLNCDVYNNEREISYGFIGGFNIAYYLKRNNRFNMAFSVGLNYSKYNSNHNFNYMDSVWTKDADQDRVLIYEQCDNLKEKQAISYIDIPLLLHFDFMLTSSFYAFVNIGYSFSIATINNSYYTELTLTRKGYYPEYNALIYDVDVPNSSYFYPTDKYMSDEGILNIKNNANLISVIGIRYRISPNLAFSLGLNSFIGVKNISNYRNNSNSTLVNNDRTINTLFYNSEKIKTNAHGLLVGMNIFF